MRTYLDCIPCFVRQTLDSIKMVTPDETIHESIIRQVLAAMATMDMSKSPPRISQKIHSLIRGLTNIPDPYAKIKQQSNAFALEILPGLRRTVAESDDPLQTALRLAIAGNIIDFGVHSVKPELDEKLIHDSISTALEAPLNMDAFRDFRDQVLASPRILYLADNAGEIAFDRLLIEQLPIQRVTVAVKGAPIINDATIEDAHAVGLTEIVSVIPNGSDAPGTILEDCSAEFREAFDTSDLIIAKGQGNFETLSNVPRNIFYLLRAKCEVIARNLRVPVGTVVIAKAP